jgi:hypothetical protein
MPSPTRGWYPDPAGSQPLRWWDGESWTSIVAPDSFVSQQGIDLERLPIPTGTPIDRPPTLAMGISPGFANTQASPTSSSTPPATPEERWATYAERVGGSENPTWEYRRLVCLVSEASIALNALARFGWEYVGEGTAGFQLEGAGSSTPTSSTIRVWLTLRRRISTGSLEP